MHSLGRTAAKRSEWVVNKMVWDQGAGGTKEDTVEHSPDPDIRLVRNIWTKCNVKERVKNVKFMWGIFACNELLFKRFGMGESVCVFTTAARRSNSTSASAPC
jgi:hypothetical protein